MNNNVLKSIVKFGLINKRLEIFKVLNEEKLINKFNYHTDFNLSINKGHFLVYIIFNNDTIILEVEPSHMGFFDKLIRDVFQ